MNIRPFLISNAKAAKLIQPCKRSLYNPAILPKSTSMGLEAFGNKGFDAPTSELLTNPCRIVRTVSKQRNRPIPRPAPSTTNRGNPIHQLYRHLRVVPVGSGQHNTQRSAVSVGQKTSFAPAFGLVRGIGTRLGPPKRARTLCESITALSQLILLAWFSRESMKRWIRSHTFSRCHSRSRRQQVIPEHPISLGSISQGIPLLSTKRMPERAFRSSTVGRPPFGFGFFCGNNGSISFQRSSGRSSRGICIPPYAVSSGYFLPFSSAIFQVLL
jgi:hypothetical protein